MRQRLWITDDIKVTRFIFRDVSEINIFSEQCSAVRTFRCVHYLLYLLSYFIPFSVYVLFCMNTDVLRERNKDAARWGGGREQYIAAKALTNEALICTHFHTEFTAGPTPGTPRGFTSQPKTAFLPHHKNRN